MIKSSAPYKMLKEYHMKLTYYIQDAYLGISGPEIAFQGVKQPFYAHNPKEHAFFDIAHHFE